MDPRSAALRAPDPDAVEFVRFCYRRRRVGWPELYDEMCAVAGRGLFRGYGPDDLAGLGIGFSLFDMPALAVLAGTVIAEEQALRRPVRVTIAPLVEADISPIIAVTDDSPTTVVATHGPEQGRDREERTIEVPIRIALAPAGA
jgi:hypothetical protein